MRLRPHRKLPNGNKWRGCPPCCSSRARTGTLTYRCERVISIRTVTVWMFTQRSGCVQCVSDEGRVILHLSFILCLTSVWSSSAFDTHFPEYFEGCKQEVNVGFRKFCCERLACEGAVSSSWLQSFHDVHTNVTWLLCYWREVQTWWLLGSSAASLLSFMMKIYGHLLWMNIRSDDVIRKWQSHWTTLTCVSLVCVHVWLWEEEVQSASVCL